uniref:Venom POBP 3 n=1 Tax=Pristhesancus plagipennis TaxID=1955184 RepID=A0A2K8JNV6_PRIPG|nr:venom POBP 3 [Pristhesancus plagipennis]
MKPVVLAFCFLAVLGISLAATTYTTQYDNIDVDSVLSNDRVYKKYFDCLTNKGKCTPEGKELKDRLPDALKTGCSKCTPKQRQGLEKVVKFLKESKPKDFDELARLYDPTGEFRKRYSAEAGKRGIKL